MGTHDAQARFGEGRGTHPEQDDAGVVPHHVAGVAGLQVPGLGLLQGAEAPGLGPGDALGHGMPGTGAGVDEPGQIPGGGEGMVVFHGGHDSAGAGH